MEVGRYKKRRGEGGIRGSRGRRLMEKSQITPLLFRKYKKDLTLYYLILPLPLHHSSISGNPLSPPFSPFPPFLLPTPPTYSSNPPPPPLTNLPLSSSLPLPIPPGPCREKPGPPISASSGPLTPLPHFSKLQVLTEHPWA